MDDLIKNRSISIHVNVLAVTVRAFLLCVAPAMVAGFFVLSRGGLVVCYPLCLRYGFELLYGGVGILIELSEEA